MHSIRTEEKTFGAALAAAIVASCFALGVAAGMLFAARVADAAPLQGRDGAPGRDGTNGTATVRVYSVVNGEVVADIDETRQVGNGESVEVRVHNGTTTVSVRSTSDGSAGRNGAPGAAAPRTRAATAVDASITAASEPAPVATSTVIVEAGASGEGTVRLFITRFVAYVARLFRP